MPSRSLRPCSWPGGCTTLVHSGRCEKHAVKDANHIPERQRLYDRKWRRIRAAYLADHPWCERCLADGIYTAATDVHHLDRHAGDPEKFYNGQLESLCKPHHSAETAKEVGWHE
jgi:5-methylcytosine-specific restriction enzyme A